MFFLGFSFSYFSTRNIFAIPIIFGFFYFLATFLSSDKVFYVAAMSFMCLGFGSLVYNLVFRVPPGSLLRQFREKPFINEDIHSSWLLLPLLTLFVLSFMIALYYYLNVGVSLFATEVGYDRLINRYSIPGARVMQRFFRVYLPICVICYYLFRFSPSLKKYYSTLLFIVMVLCTSFFLIAGGMRGNIVIFFFIPLIYTRSLIKRINFLEMFVMFSFTFTLGLIVTIKMYASTSAQLLFKILLSRFTTGASDGLGVIVGGYTDRVGLQLGQSFYADIASIFSKLGILQHQYVSLGEEIAMHLLGNRYNGERAAVYFSGELFHNFGNIGVVIGSILIGFLMQYLYVKTLRSRKDIFFFPMVAFITAAFSSILGGPVLASLIDYIAVLVLFIGIVFFTNYIFSRFSSKIFILGRWVKTF